MIAFTTPSRKKWRLKMPLADDYPEFYAAWVAGGGIENALRDAMMAAKVIPATPDAAVDFVSRVCATGAAILRNLNEQGK